MVSFDGEPKGLTHELRYPINRCGFVAVRESPFRVLVDLFAAQRHTEMLPEVVIRGFEM